MIYSLISLCKNHIGTDAISNIISEHLIISNMDNLLDCCNIRKKLTSDHELQKIIESVLLNSKWRWFCYSLLFDGNDHYEHIIQGLENLEVISKNQKIDSNIIARLLFSRRQFFIKQ